MLFEFGGREIRAADLHRQSMKDDPAYREAFAEQESEFALLAGEIVRGKQLTKPKE
jgi:hypothetical protein